MAKTSEARLNIKGTLKSCYVGESKFSKNKEMKYIITLIPDDLKEARFNLAQFYVNYSTKDKKWIPEFVTEERDELTLSSNFDIPLVLDDQETSLSDFIADYGTPVKGTPVEAAIKIKTAEDGKVAFYPMAIRIPRPSVAIDVYSMRNLFLT